MLTTSEYCQEHMLFKASMKLITRTGIYYPSITRPLKAMFYMVCGAPASGKTTFAFKNMEDGDKIIDLDIIHSEISHQPIHSPKTEEDLARAVRARNELLESFQDSSFDHHIWFIIGGSNSADRMAWKSILRPKKVYVLLCPP